MKPWEVRCRLGCGQMTAAPNGECKTCHRLHRMDIHVPGRADGLKGGRWVRDGLIVRWEKAS